MSAPYQTRQKRLCVEVFIAALLHICMLILLQRAIERTLRLQLTSSKLEPPGLDVSGCTSCTAEFIHSKLENTSKSPTQWLNVT